MSCWLDLDVVDAGRVLMGTAGAALRLGTVSIITEAEVKHTSLAGVHFTATCL